MDIGYLGAFLGGLLSLLSPCSVMLLPAFFAYAFSKPSTLVSRTGVFYLGLITTLVPLGVLAGTVGAFLTEHRTTLMVVVALIVIAFGLVQIIGIEIPGLGRTGSGGDAGRVFAVYVLGTAYGVAGVCTGPILGSVLMIAAVGANPVYGGLLLMVYAAGMALPLMLIALAWKTWGGGIRRALRPRTVTIGRWTNSWHALISGALSVVLGILLLFVARAPEAGGLLPIGLQYRLETGAVLAGAHSSNLVVLGVVALLALAGVALWWRRMRARERAEAEGS